MKIHPRPPLPPPSLAPQQKPPPTSFQIEQKAEELIAVAQQQRTQRAKLTRVRRDRQPSHDSAESDRNGQDPRPSRGTVDVLA